MARDKVNLDIFWLRDESLEDSANPPEPDVLAAEIVEDLQAALEQFVAIVEDLGGVELLHARVPGKTAMAYVKPPTAPSSRLRASRCTSGRSHTARRPVSRPRLKDAFCGQQAILPR